MDELSEREVRDLGERFSIAVRDREAETLREQVNELLANLDAVYDAPVRGNDTPTGDRTWQEADDEYNSFIVSCHVPPTENHSGLLNDVTVGLKDVISVAGVPMTAGSEVLRGFVPAVDATVTRRLREAGATITGKTNLDELTIAGAWGTTSAYRSGPVRNPHDPERAAGGSSSGSAAAVGAGLVDVALGTDTGGSVRTPASFCGIVGLKPTYGLVPATGVLETAYTQDHIGPMTATVADAARVLEAIAGKDPRDGASLRAAGHDGYQVGGYVDAVDGSPPPSEVSIGVLKEGFGKDVTGPVEETTRRTIDVLDDAGVDVREMSVDEFHHVKPAKNIISYTEEAAHWRAAGAAYRNNRTVDEELAIALGSRARTSSEKLDQNAKGKLLAGAEVIENQQGRHYLRAQEVRWTIRTRFRQALESVDVLLTPTTPSVAPRLEELQGTYGSAMSESEGSDFDFGRNTRVANLTQLPSITIPNGVADGAPVGLQLLGDAFDDARLLAIAARIESLIDDALDS